MADCKRKPQSGRRRRKPHVRHAQQWGVGWRSSTDEAVEQSNGSSTRAAERVEGRAPTKENVQQARAVPAQHGAAASQGLKGVRKVAKSSACRYPSKVRAVCVNRARTDPCGGCEATRIPTATSSSVVC